jgi:hypothetical protein
MGEEKATIKILAQRFQSIEDALKASPMVMGATYIHRADLPS